MAMHKGMVGRIPSTQDKGPASDKTLGDYLDRKYPPNDDHRFPTKKLTFDEWWSSSEEALRFGERRKLHFQQCWKAAQENK